MGDCRKLSAPLFLTMEKQYAQAETDDLKLNADQRLCMTCKKNVKGRTDKKFCNETCRNSFYNQLNAGTNNLVRNINHALGKNRRILESFFTGEDKIITASASQLLQKGFLFKYFTHQYTNKKGSTYYFCYDYGYLLLHNKYLLVKGREG